MLRKESRDKAEQAMSECDYERAINFYSLAIQNDPENSCLYSGRAKAYLKYNRENGGMNSQKWKRIQQDCSKATQLDGNNYDAIYFLGLFYADGSSKYGKGLKLIEEAYSKAIELIKRNKSYLPPQDIYLDIFRVKNLIRQTATEQHIVNSNSLFIKLMKYLEVEYHSEIEKINSKSIHKDQRDYTIAALATAHNDDVKSVIRVFENNYNHATQINDKEPPEYFVCPISFQLMHDPVTAPSGISYEKSVLWDALSRSSTDPFTRQKMRKDDCIPNRNLKLAIEDYVAISRVKYQ